MRLVGFIIKKSVTMHGHMKVKFVKRTLLMLTYLVLQGSICEELFKHRFGLPSGLFDVTLLSFAPSPCSSLMFCKQ